MSKKNNISLLIISLLVLFGGAYFLVHLQNSKRNVQIISKTEVSKDVLQNVAPEADAQKSNFFVSGWLPYWQKDAGAVSLDGNLKIFNEINPFDFGVTPEGNIIDTVG